jgi:hypothetical protein
VTWTTAATAGATAVILIDDVVLQRPTDFGHVQYALFAGATDFADGDKFTVTTTNDYGGVFQTWFGGSTTCRSPAGGGHGRGAIHLPLDPRFPASRSITSQTSSPRRNAAALPPGTRVTAVSAGPAGMPHCVAADAACRVAALTVCSS